MATIVDQLVVTLTLDNSGLRRTAQEAENSFRQIIDSFRRHGLSIEATARSVGYGLDSLRLGFLALGLAATAALKGIKDIADQAASNTALARHAGAVHKTTEEYALLRQTQENFAKGGGAALDQFSDKYTQAVEQFKLTGDWPEQFNYLRGLHISPVDPVTGKWKDFEQVMKEVAAATRGMNDAEAKAWGEGNGIAWVTLSFYRQSNDEIRKQSEETKRIGVLNKEQVKASQEIWTSWSETLQTIEYLTNTGMVSFKKEILEILKDVRDIVAEFKFLFGIVTAINELLNKITGTENSGTSPWHDFFGIGGATERGVDYLFGPGASKNSEIPAKIGKWLDEHLGTGKSPAVDEYIKGGIDRSSFADEIKNNPYLFYKAADMVAGEVGKTAPLETQRAQLETAFNRAQRRGQSLAEVLLSVSEDPSRGYYASDTYRNQMNGDDLERFKRDVWDPVMAGSNLAHGFTGNASAGVAARQYARGTPGFDLPAAGGAHESYFNEGPFRHPLPRVPMLPPAGVNSFVDRYSGINSTMSTTNNSAHIENLTVNTNVTDAVGFAKEVGGALDSHAFTSNANNGPQ